MTPAVLPERGFRGSKSNTHSRSNENVAVYLLWVLDRCVRRAGRALRRRLVRPRGIHRASNVLHPRRPVASTRVMSVTGSRCRPGNNSPHPSTDRVRAPVELWQFGDEYRIRLTRGFF